MTNKVVKMQRKHDKFRFVYSKEGNNREDNYVDRFSKRISGR